MVDIEKLKALAEKARDAGDWHEDGGFLHSVMGGMDADYAVAASPAAVLELIAEVERLRQRASYWKQRAKSAEGPLYLSDWEEARKALHQHTELSGTPWDELTDSQRAQIGSVAGSVLRVIDQRRTDRRPHDARAENE